MPEHFNRPWHRLLAGDAIADLGVALRWQDFPDGTGAMVSALDAGRLEVAVLLTEGAAAAVARGCEFEVVSLYTETPLIWGIHVAAASTLTEIDDVPAARIAISRYGSGSHLMALALANERGWRARDLRFVETGTLEGAVESFRNGDSEVFLWEKFMTQPVVDRGDFRRIGDFSAPWPAFVTCVRQDLLRRQRPTAERLIDLVGQEAQAFSGSPEAPGEIAREYGLAEPAAKEWLSRTRWAGGLAPADAALDAARKVLVQAGAIGG